MTAHSTPQNNDSLQSRQAHNDFRLRVGRWLRSDIVPQSSRLHIELRLPHGGPRTGSAQHCALLWSGFPFRRSPSPAVRRVPMWRSACSDRAAALWLYPRRTVTDATRKMTLEDDSAVSRKMQQDIEPISTVPKQGTPSG